MREHYVAIEKEMPKLMNFIALLYRKWEKNKDVRVYQESYQEGDYVSFIIDPDDYQIEAA